jgi:uncharacterized OB-fold protein
MRIVPKPDELTAPYWEAAKQGRLLIQHCRACGRSWHPPTPVCNACQSFDVEWRESSGRGEVYSHTTIHHPTHVAMQGRTPYLVALVDLEDGPRLVANIRDCPMEEVRIGLKVEVTFEEIAPGVVLPQFRPRTPA